MKQLMFTLVGWVVVLIVMALLAGCGPSGGSGGDQGQAEGEPEVWIIEGMGVV